MIRLRWPLRKRPDPPTDQRSPLPAIRQVLSEPIQMGEFRPLGRGLWACDVTMVLASGLGLLVTHAVYDIRTGRFRPGCACCFDSHSPKHPIGFQPPTPAHHGEQS